MNEGQRLYTPSLRARVKRALRGGPPPSPIWRRRHAAWRLWSVGGFPASTCCLVVDELGISKLDDPKTLLAVFTYALLMYREKYYAPKWGRRVHA